MELITVSQIKSGRYFKLIPYKSIYMVVTDEHAGCVQYHIINCEHGIVTATFPNVALVVEFLNKWKARPTKATIAPLLDSESELQ
jgi:hypothetical protein